MPNMWRHGHGNCQSDSQTFRWPLGEAQWENLGMWELNFAVGRTCSKGPLWTRTFHFSSEKDHGWWEYARRGFRGRTWPKGGGCSHSWGSHPRHQGYWSLSPGPPPPGTTSCGFWHVALELIPLSCVRREECWFRILGVFLSSRALSWRPLGSSC